MSTQCYSMVRGSAIRVTGLTARGGFADEIPYVVSKSVAKVIVNEVSEGGSNELLRNEEDEPRLHFVRSTETVRFTVDIQFTKCDPGLLSLISGVPVVLNASGDVVGFDANTRMAPVAFGMELWSKIASNACDSIYPPGAFGVGEFGVGAFGVQEDAEIGRKWGYTLLPFLKGGILSGFVFSDGLVSFNLRNAAVQRRSKWGQGPYDLLGEGKRLYVPVSGNLNIRQVMIPAQPPTPTQGISYFTDIIEGGSASTTTSDIIDGEDAALDSSTIIDGGTAA